MGDWGAGGGWGGRPGGKAGGQHGALSLPRERGSTRTKSPCPPPSHPPVPPQEMLTYGLRGLAAYTHHAAMLGQRSANVDAFIADAYAFLCTPDASDVGKVRRRGAWRALSARCPPARAAGTVSPSPPLPVILPPHHPPPHTTGAGHDPQGGRDQPGGHGPAGWRPRVALWPPRALACAPRPQEGQGHPGVGPRHGGEAGVGGLAVVVWGRAGRRAGAGGDAGGTARVSGPHS